MDYSGTYHFDLLRISITIVQIRVQSLQFDKRWERIKEKPICTELGVSYVLSVTCSPRALSQSPRGQELLGLCLGPPGLWHLVSVPQFCCGLQISLNQL